MLPTVLSLMVISSLATILGTTPMPLALSILMMALSTAYLFSSTLSSWMAFLVFIIYISGILVMFAYFVAMSPNVSLPMKSFTILIPTWLLILLMLLQSPMQLPSSMMSNINTFYSKASFPILIILALILLLAMIIVVKISSSQKGPLRPFYQYV